jgi:hypothetical protein
LTWKRARRTRDVEGSVSKLEAFRQRTGMPREMVPYIDLVATDREIDLLLGLGDQAMTLGQVAEMMGMGGAAAEDLLVSATRRALVDRETRQGTTSYRAGTFYRRLTYLSMQDYEAWILVPEEVRESVIA